MEQIGDKSEESSTDNSLSPDLNEDDEEQEQKQVEHSDRDIRLNILELSR